MMNYKKLLEAVIFALDTKYSLENSIRKMRYNEFPTNMPMEKVNEQFDIIATCTDPIAEEPVIKKFRIELCHLYDKYKARYIYLMQKSERKEQDKSSLSR